jgi:ribulose-phosphate 3-epimerase
MIENPDRWALGYAEVGARNVTVHIEAVQHPVALAADLRSAGALAGLAIKPRTPLESYLPLLGHFDTLLIMSAEPGFRGQAFIPKVLNKVSTARRLIDTGNLRLLIEIDGGINVETIRAAAQAGADCFVAGSAVYGTEDRVRAVHQLRQQATRALTSS